MEESGWHVLKGLGAGENLHGSTRIERFARTETTKELCDSDMRETIRVDLVEHHSINRYFSIVAVIACILLKIVGSGLILAWSTRCKMESVAWFINQLLAEGVSISLLLVAIGATCRILYDGSGSAITLVSKIDFGDPLYLHASDTTGTPIIPIKLKGTENYTIWSRSMKLALSTKNKVGFIDATCVKNNDDPVLASQWDRCNSNELQETYNKVDGSNIFNLHIKINSLKQNGVPISDYYHSLNTLWKQYDEMVKILACTCAASNELKEHTKILRLNQFLMGLDDEFMQIRSNILLRDPIPDVKTAFAVISREESHRKIASNHSSNKNQNSAFLSHFKSTNSGNTGSTQSYNKFKKGPNPNLKCNKCNKIGHTIDRCFEIIGYPSSYKRTPQNNNNRSISSNNVVTSNNASSVSDMPSSSSSSPLSLTNDQMTKLLSLLNEPSVQSSNACSNMEDSGANQHMTVSENSLFNVVDISDFNLKVSHPNGTEAKLNKIGNLQLTSKIVLYDVLVVPGYCVSLLSVSKLAADSGLFIDFDRHKCYVQDLMSRNTLVTGSNIRGLYVFNKHQGLLAKKDLGIFLTIVDDYTGAVWSMGMIHQTTIPYTPQQNGVVERKHRHILNVARSLMFQGEIPLIMWPECVLTATYLINRTPSKILAGKTPFELVHGFEPNLSHLKSFGCLVFSKVLNDFDKFHSKSEKAVFIGYSNSKKDAKVNKNPNDEGRAMSDVDCQVATPTGSLLPESDSNLGDSVDDNVHENELPEGNLFNQNTSENVNEPVNQRKSERVTVLPRKFDDYVVEGKVKYGLERVVNLSKLSHDNYVFASVLNKSIEPKNYQQVVTDPNWVTAMNDEMEALYRNNTWILTDLPGGRNPIGCRWIYKIKYKSSGEIERYKVRLVAKGYSQREGIDYEETYSPVAKMVTVRCLLTVAIQNNWNLYQLDVNNAFLYGDLSEDVYMELPQGYFSPTKTRVCKLVKSLYGLKHAPRQWNEKLTLVLKENGFVQSLNDYSLFVKCSDSLFLALLRKYCIELLDEFGLTGCKPVGAPLETNVSIVSEPTDNDPPLSHLNIALRLLRYLKGSPGKGVLLKKADSISLTAFVDADWESEYRALASITCEILWILKVLKDLNYTNLLHVPVHCDNRSTILLAANPVFHERSKHFEIDLHLVRNKCTSGVIDIVQIDSENQTADIFTKGLGINQHNFLCYFSIVAVIACIKDSWKWAYFSLEHKVREKIVKDECEVCPIGLSTRGAQFTQLRVSSLRSSSPIGLLDSVGTHCGCRYLKYVSPLSYVLAQFCVHCPQRALMDGSKFQHKNFRKTSSCRLLCQFKVVRCQEVQPKHPIRSVHVLSMLHLR
ncbi:uncharacterized protein [Rutidosis leptorrhynchoides]|uniref:uncharacterized protein n=1 Tax=Rutidosis leptorrhynchoides TaxID=125765 RepID=UPI003A99CCAC